MDRSEPWRNDAKPYICDICGTTGITTVYIDVILAYAVGIMFNRTQRTTLSHCFAPLNALYFIDPANILFEPFVVVCIRQWRIFPLRQISESQTIHSIDV